MTDINGQRIFLTGAAGFLGANLARRLLALGAEVHVLLKPSSDLWRLAEILPPLTVHTVSLIDTASLKSLLVAIQPQAVFHLAAVGGHLPGWQEQAESLGTAVLGTATLLEALDSLVETRIVHVGSSTEYGAKVAPIRETDLLEPGTARGVAKAAATLLCQQWGRSRKRHLVILRPFSIFGPWEQPVRLLPTVIRAVSRGEEILLTEPGYRRDFVHVDDVVEACLRALEIPEAHGEVINVGSGQQRTNEEAVALVQQLCERTVPVKIGAYGAHPTDARHWVADIGKARQVLRWEPRVTFEYGLQQTIVWFRDHLDQYDAWFARHKALVSCGGVRGQGIER